MGKSTGRAETPGSSGAADWREGLRGVMEVRATRVHLVGVGNRLRRDDAAGLEITSRLRSRLGAASAGGVEVHPESAMPERLLSKLARNEGKVIVFDAVEASRSPGEIVFRRVADTKYGLFATHNIPLRLVPGLAEREEDFFLVGVQPASLEVGERLSPEVQASVRRIVGFVADEVEERS